MNKVMTMIYELQESRALAKKYIAGLENEIVSKYDIIDAVLKKARIYIRENDLVRKRWTEALHITEEVLLREYSRTVKVHERHIAKAIAQIDETVHEMNFRQVYLDCDNCKAIKQEFAEKLMKDLEDWDDCGGRATIQKLLLEKKIRGEQAETLLGLVRDAVESFLNGNLPHFKFYMKDLEETLSGLESQIQMDALERHLFLKLRKYRLNNVERADFKQKLKQRIRQAKKEETKKQLTELYKQIR